MCHACRGLLIILKHFPTALPLHYIQGKRGGLRCYVPPGLQATQNSSLPNDALARIFHKCMIKLFCDVRCRVESRCSIWTSCVAQASACVLSIRRNSNHTG